MASAHTITGDSSPQGTLRWLPVLIGLSVLYVHTFSYSWNAVWQQEDFAYAPLILVVSCWLLWGKRSQLLSEAVPASAIGWGLLTLGLLLYIIGRSQSIYILEMGSLSPVLAGAFAVVSGKTALRAARFPLFFMLFMVPLPGPLVDAVTGPLKQMVSICAETLLYSAGYPIARSGVVLSIDQYQLLVADACSGLHSMFSLTALGVLYLHMMGRRQSWRNPLLLAGILPIAFLANVIRVVILVLVTYYLGEAAGQGFIHGFAGMILFMAALAMLMAVDGSIDMLLRLRAGKSSA